MHRVGQALHIYDREKWRHFSAASWLAGWLVGSQQCTQYVLTFSFSSDDPLALNRLMYIIVLLLLRRCTTTIMLLSEDQ